MLVSHPSLTGKGSVTRNSRDEGRNVLNEGLLVKGNKESLTAPCRWLVYPPHSFSPPLPTVQIDSLAYFSNSGSPWWFPFCLNLLLFVRIFFWSNWNLHKSNPCEPVQVHRQPSYAHLPNLSRETLNQRTFTKTLKVISSFTFPFFFYLPFFLPQFQSGVPVHLLFLGLVLWPVPNPFFLLFSGSVRHGTFGLLLSYSSFHPIVTVSEITRSYWWPDLLLLQWLVGVLVPRITTDTIGNLPQISFNPHPH